MHSFIVDPCCIAMDGGNVRNVTVSYHRSPEREKFGCRPKSYLTGIPPFFFQSLLVSDEI